MKLLRVLLALMVISAILLMAMPVYADEPDPDSTPSVEEFNVYRNVLVPGDFLLLIEANIPYSVATMPDYPVNYTYMWRLFDTDNVTELGTTLGYAYNDDGYNWNVWSIYFDSDHDPAWLQNYPVRLSQNPAHFDTPQDWNFKLGASDYNPLTDTADVKAAIAARILSIATSFNIKWGLLSGYYLTTEIETGTVLSIYGESFFRGAIYGVQGMAPRVFSYIFTEMDIEDRTWSENYTGNLTGQWAGYWVQDAKDAGQALFGTSYDLLSLIMAVGMCIGAAIAGVMVGGEGWGGMLDASVVGVMAARLGMFGLGYWGLLCAVCIIYIGMRIFKPFGG